MDELILEKNTPTQVLPSSGLMIVQNTMGTTDDPLYVSTHGDINKKWLTVESGCYVKFDEPLFFMQGSWNNFVFPVVEGA